MIIPALPLGGLGYKRKPKKPYVRGNRPYTEREEKIINGDYIATLRRGDVNRLIEKAEKKGDTDIADSLREMYDELLNNENYYLPNDHKIIDGECSNASKTAIYRVLGKAINNGDGETVTKLIEIYHLPREFIDPYGYYTIREMMIIKGEGIENIPSVEVTKVMNKAIQVDDYKIVEALSERYDLVLNTTKKKSKYTLKEARAVLDELDQKYKAEHSKS